MTGPERESDPPAIEVDIFGADMAPCAGCCGSGLSEEELTETARIGLARRFGERVRVTYHSLRDPSVMKQYADLLAAARRQGIPLPLTVVDGAVLQGGGIDYRAIVNAVEVKSETIDY